MPRSPQSRSEKSFWLAQAFVLAAALSALGSVRQSNVPEAAREAYDASNYREAVKELQAAAAKDPANGEVQLLLTKCYLELQEHDAAITSAERAVAIEPNNSVYHEWLGKAYGEKASHVSVFSALGLARKTHKEFETAVQLDERNFSATQALIEFDCSAPSIAGGGEDKAKLEIARLEEMDAAEWHYAAGNCRRQKKDFAAADSEFQKSLESRPKSAELIYDIGDYAVRRSAPATLLEVADLGEQASPSDPRDKFYRAVALILKNEKPEESARLLREYLQKAPRRNAYPRYATVHGWMGRLYEGRGDKAEAEKEYRAALQADPKDKIARDGLKRLGKE